MSRYDDWGQPIGEALPGWVPPPLPSRVMLTGRYCVVTPLDVELHAHELFDALSSDPDQRRWTYLPYGPFENWGSFRDWVEAATHSSDPLFFAILDAASGRARGIASYLRITPASGSIEVGHLNFSAELARRPAATEAMYLMMKHAFGLGYRRYEWKCDVLNAPSRIAAQRLGLSFEGIFRCATVYKSRSRDTAWFAAIHSEWSELARAFEAWLAPSNFDSQGAQRTRLAELTAPILVRRGPP